MGGFTPTVSTPRVELQLLSEVNLSDLLDAAVADADPADVMPPVPGPPGWTENRRRAFRDFHRSRSIATAEPAENTYVITLDDRVIGAARLQPSGDSVEMGVWVGRSHRGRGIGRLVAADLLTLAQRTDATRIVASTTSRNTAAQRLLQDIGATLTTNGDSVDAILDTHWPTVAASAGRGTRASGIQSGDESPSSGGRSQMVERPWSTAGVGRVLTSGLENAIHVHQAAVTAYVQRARRRRPDASPAELIATLEKQYLAAVTGTGAAVGASAAAPGVGAGFALAVSAGETVTFLETTMLFTLAVAELHRVPVEDIERRRTLLFSILLGDSGPRLVQKIAGRTGKHWGKLITDAIPMSSIRSINKVLGPRVVTKYGTKQGILVISRTAPFGIGAGIGAGGNLIVGRSVIAGMRRAFGPSPASLPTQGSPSRTLPAT